MNRFGRTSFQMLLFMAWVPVAAIAVVFRLSDPTTPAAVEEKNVGSEPEANTVDDVTEFTPQFFAPQLTPTQFLFISSPSHQKVVYTELNNFKSKTGRVLALVDSGLVEPAGLAFDNERALLYVADRGASKIYRYRVLAKEVGLERKGYQLLVDGVRLCIMQGRPVEWISIDPSGDLFYSDTSSNTINRIPVGTLNNLGEGLYQCGDLRVVSQREQMSKAELKSQADMQLDSAQRAQEKPLDDPDPEPVIISVYEGSSNPHITVPGGVASDGDRLYWGNTVEGMQAGSVVRGETRPESPLLASRANGTTFPNTALTSVSDSAQGVARSNTMVFFTSSKAGTGSVYGVTDDGMAQQFVSSLVKPKGLVWDGDSTVYVADQATSKVWSFPVGRFMEEAPLTLTAAYSGAFGVALYTKTSGNFEINSTAFRSRNFTCLILSLVGLMTAFGSVWTY